MTDVNYIHNRNARRIGAMIFGIWAVAGVVSLAPVLGWKDPDFLRRIEEEKSCLISQDVAYQVFATFATFYVPLTLILILYWRIFQVRSHKHNFFLLFPIFIFYLLKPNVIQHSL